MDALSKRESMIFSYNFEFEFNYWIIKWMNEIPTADWVLSVKLWWYYDVNRVLKQCLLNKRWQWWSDDCDKKFRNKTVLIVYFKLWQLFSQYKSIPKVGIGPSSGLSHIKSKICDKNRAKIIRGHIRNSRRGVNDKNWIDGRVPATKTA